MTTVRFSISARAAYNIRYVNVKCHDRKSMPTYTITELATEFAITPRTIRFYEDQGLLSPTREGSGHRIYAARERTRLKLALRGKRLGLSLAEIKSLVDMYESPKDSEAQLTEFLQVLTQHRARLEQQREDLETTLTEIAVHETQCLQLLVHMRPAAHADPHPTGQAAP